MPSISEKKSDRNEGPCDCETENAENLIKRVCEQGVSLNKIGKEVEKLIDEVSEGANRLLVQLPFLTENYIKTQLTTLSTIRKDVEQLVNDLEETENERQDILRRLQEYKLWSETSALFWVNLISYLRERALAC